MSLQPNDYEEGVNDGYKLAMERIVKLSTEIMKNSSQPISLKINPEKKWEEEFEAFGFINDESGNLVIIPTKIEGDFADKIENYLNLPEEININYNYKKAPQVKIRARKNCIQIERID